ncbi:hypothetical protein NQ315_008955 [Exocentrus adspersus]|uniref:DDE Tnp4 domain-containing protein n=1 Tax=Exocentrus adspersus TaxID=1586481 RepID=A0AAV8V8K4_9CUCU|nr:hypothetical protein NQ315_008955 [Exocentrus adspersus]
MPVRDPSVARHWKHPRTPVYTTLHKKLFMAQRASSFIVFNNSTQASIVKAVTGLLIGQGGLPGLESHARFHDRNPVAYPNRWSDLEPMFGLSNKSLSDIGNYVMNIIYQNNGHLLFHLGSLPWLDENRMRMYAEAIVARGGLVHNCWSCIDGTARAMCRPILNQENYYSGHKRFHALKYQSVVSPDGIIINLQGPYPGRRHDAAILRESNFYEQLEQHAVFPNGHSFVVYGDSAYGIRELLLCPFPNTEHVQDEEERGAQQNFNHLMSVTLVALKQDQDHSGRVDIFPCFPTLVDCNMDQNEDELVELFSFLLSSSSSSDSEEEEIVELINYCDDVDEIPKS